MDISWSVSVRFSPAAAYQFISLFFMARSRCIFLKFPLNLPEHCSLARFCRILISFLKNLPNVVIGRDLALLSSFFVYSFGSSSSSFFLRAPLIPDAGVSSSRNSSETSFGIVFITVTLLDDFSLPPFHPIFELPVEALVLVLILVVFGVFLLITCTIGSLCSSSSFSKLALRLSPWLPPWYFLPLTSL